jgi:hypothetical protein
MTRPSKWVGVALRASELGTSKAPTTIGRKGAQGHPTICGTEFTYGRAALENQRGGEMKGLARHAGRMPEVRSRQVVVRCYSASWQARNRESMTTGDRQAKRPDPSHDKGIERSDGSAALQGSAQVRSEGGDEASRTLGVKSRRVVVRCYSASWQARSRYRRRR